LASPPRSRSAQDLEVPPARGEEVDDVVLEGRAAAVAAERDIGPSVDRPVGEGRRLPAPYFPGGILSIEHPSNRRAHVVDGWQPLVALTVPLAVIRDTNLTPESKKPAVRFHSPTRKFRSQYERSISRPHEGS